MAQQENPKPKPLGQPIEWSDSELDDLSQVGPGDVQAAKDLWKTQAPAEFKKLLEAEPDEGDSNNVTGKI
jgi:hypothetical protein